jgi:polyvinyl alcohol dehydrogenase (cytochrome)
MKLFSDQSYWIGCLVLLISNSCWALSSDRQQLNKIHSGAQLFKNNCSHCHNDNYPKAPKKSALQKISQTTIYEILTNGVMRKMASHLSDEQRQQLAGYLGGNKSATTIEKVQCENNAPWFDYSQRPLINGWGMTNTENTRFIPDAIAGLSFADVKRLKLKWAFSLPDGKASRAQPVIAGGAIFIGGNDGAVYALDADSGCMHWRFDGGSSRITTASISGWKGERERDEINAPTLYFADRDTVRMYAVNAVTGNVRWTYKVDKHPDAKLTGTPTLYQSAEGNYLYVPVSSTESYNSVDPSFNCCTFRGAVVAINADNGELVWKSYVIPTEPTEQYKNANGVPQFGPSGAGVWSSPTIDKVRGRLYVGTGENNSSPAENGGSVVAINLRDGSIAWVMQGVSGEAYNSSCGKGDEINCPRSFKGRKGFDFAASPILIRSENNKDIIVAGQKTGWVFGLDPDSNGKIVWRRSISRGDINKGVMFGMAVEGTTVFTTTRDGWSAPRDGSPYLGKEELGIYALNGLTGQFLWSAPVARDCKKTICLGYSAALTAIPGIVFAAANDGDFRAFESATGEVLWRFDTVKKFSTVNGGESTGGGVYGPGPVINNGMVYLSSGNQIGMPGNVFLVFSVNGR